MRTRSTAKVYADRLSAVDDAMTHAARWRHDTTNTTPTTRSTPPPCAADRGPRRRGPADLYAPSDDRDRRTRPTGEAPPLRLEGRDAIAAHLSDVYDAT